MALKTTLIVLTLISVVADTMVLPFYPQFFSQAFGMTDPEHVGFYIAACCFTVMVAFPIWARVAHRVHELHLWIITQLIAAALGVFCYYTTSLVQFWIASQLMLVFKASYLLIYPFVMRLEEKDKHLGVASLFSVLMHFGGIGGAILGGLTLDYFNARDLYLIMPASDLIQVGLCVYLIYALKISHKPHLPPVPASHKSPSLLTRLIPKLSGYVWRLGLVSLMFYFSAFLTRPFFTKYWQQLTQSSEFITSWVYAIPAWIALACMAFNHWRGHSQNSFSLILWGAVFGVLGMFLQSSEQITWIVVGRCLFGYAMFQITVRLEVLLFAQSSPEKYSSDFSTINFMQNLGVIGASFLVGYLADHYALSLTFTLGAIGFTASLAAFLLLCQQFKQSKQDNTASAVNDAQTAGAES